MIDREVLNSMRRDWDQRAKENARHFVASSQEEWTDDDFFRSGAAEVQALVGDDLATICNGRSPSDMAAIEIGCGAGRMTLALSRIFGRMAAVDVSPEMIARAKIALKDCTNVDLHANNGCDLSMFQDEIFDFAISAIVFQHIPRQSIVENYIGETWRVLRPGSMFRFQLQGVPILEKNANTWVGVGFSEKRIHEVASRCGFQVAASQGAGTQYYWLTFRKPAK